MRFLGAQDQFKNGVIEYTEFLAATLEVNGHIQEDRLAEAFDRIDSDNSGFISKKVGGFTISPSCMFSLTFLFFFRICWISWAQR